MKDLCNKYENNVAEYLGATDKMVKVSFSGLDLETIENHLNEIYTGEDNKLLAEAIVKFCKE